jgi:hypothetical protein
MIANANTWVDIERYGRTKLDFLRRFLELPNGSRQFSELGVAPDCRKLAQLRACRFASLSAWTPATNSNRRCVRDGSTSIGWSTLS